MISHRDFITIDSVEREFNGRMGKMATVTSQDDKVREVDLKEEEPMIIEEFDMEELFVDGICGVY